MSPKRLCEHDRSIYKSDLVKFKRLRLYNIVDFGSLWSKERKSQYKKMRRVRFNDFKLIKILKNIGI